MQATTLAALAAPAARSAGASQSNMRHYFTSNKPAAEASNSGLANGSEPSQTVLAAAPTSLGGGTVLGLAAAPATTVHSSQAFARPAASGAPVAAAGAAGPSSLSSVSPASSRSAPSSSGSGRRRKRDEGSEDTGSSGSCMDESASNAPSAPSPLSSKLPARTLLYQLHVLRNDEQMQVSGVLGGSSGIEIHVQTLAEAEKQLQSREEAEAAAAAAAEKQPPASSVWDSSVMYDEERKGAAAASAAAAAGAGSDDDAGTAESPEAEAATALLSTASPLFSESDEWVSLFLSASAAHKRFQQLRSYWSARGVRHVRARVIEFQLAEPLQLLVVTNESQRKAWIDSALPPTTSNTMVVDEAAPPPANVRVSPFTRRTVRRNPPLHPPSASAVSALASSAAASVSSTAGAAASASSSGRPSLFASPTLSPALRSLLDAREDTLQGFCVAVSADPTAAAASSSAASAANSSSADAGEMLELSDRSVVDAEVILRGSVCSTLLQLVDDDKQGRWSQQLLTDLFARMDMGKKKKQHGASSSTSLSGQSAAAGSGTRAPWQVNPAPQLQIAPSSFAPHVLQTSQR